MQNSPIGRSVYACNGANTSVASGRLSFLLGLRGPCSSVDSACSAALVACHFVATALQLEECTRGLAGGVNLMLLPTYGTRFSVAGMTSPRGRCFTFDERADGYARSEACCMATATSDAVSGVQFTASCVRQDGKSASLTSPNGRAQADLVKTAISSAGRGPTFLEAHGTGTGLGDPIEASSLITVLSEHSARIGTAKANAGHSESAAGLSGLLRLKLALCIAFCPPNAQLRIMNPFMYTVMVHVDQAAP
eukprot:6658906-Prymnesium_polylepis.1